jgi:hypothetical protein
MELIVRLTTSWLMERHIDVAKGLVYLSMENAHYLYIIIGLDHGVGHFRPLSITRQRHLLAYHGTAMSHEGLCQVF